MQQQQQQAGQQNDMSLSNGMNMVRESPHQKDETNPEMVRLNAILFGSNVIDNL